MQRKVPAENERATAVQLEAAGRAELAETKGEEDDPQRES